MCAVKFVRTQKEKQAEQEEGASIKNLKIWKNSYCFQAKNMEYFFSLRCDKPKIHTTLEEQAIDFF